MYCSTKSHSGVWNLLFIYNFVLIFCLDSQNLVIADDLLLDTQADLTQDWKVGSTCIYQNNYTEYISSHCRVSIDPNQDDENNSGTWSPCEYPSCEIIYANANPNQIHIPTGIEIRSYLRSKDSTKFPPRILISIRATPESLKYEVGHFTALNDWQINQFNLEGVTETSVSIS